MAFTPAQKMRSTEYSKSQKVLTMEAKDSSLFSSSNVMMEVNFLISCDQLCRLIYRQRVPIDFLSFAVICQVLPQRVVTQSSLCVTIEPIKHREVKLAPIC